MSTGGASGLEGGVNRRLLLAVLISAVFVAVMNSSMVNVAVPVMRRDFGASEAQVGWVITSYLLIYAVDRTAAPHRASVSWWNGLLSGAETVGLSWTVLLGFLRLTTNPRVVRAPLTTADAFEYIDRWLDHPVTTVVEPTPRHARVMRDLLADLGTAGDLVADAHLAALAIEHGAELCSADHDFGRFPGLRWRNPLVA